MSANLHYLDQCRDWLEPALRLNYPDKPWSDLQIEAMRMTIQVWPGERSAMLTRLMKDDGGRIHVWLGGGDLDELLEMRPGVEAWGRGQGCTHATIRGRMGWVRVLRAAGYRRKGDELRKELV